MRQIISVTFYDRTGIEKELEKQATKGWLLEKCAATGWIYRRIEPAKIHFAVVYFPAISIFYPEPSEKQKRFQEFCEHTGWDLIATNAQMQIFCNHRENPIPDDTVFLKNIFLTSGDKTKYITHPNQSDMERIEKAIYEAQIQADYILVSIHSHELSGDKKENPSMFLQEFAHRCIDAGANAVIGHGPHLLCPVEIYKKRPIFYSLGDFVIHNECIPYAPEEMYALQKLTSDYTMRDVCYKRSAGYTKGLMRDRRMLESVIPYFEMEDGALTYLELMPIELQFDKKLWQSSNPRFSAEHGIIERLSDMSAPFGTKITVDSRGFGVVTLE